MASKLSDGRLKRFVIFLNIIFLLVGCFSVAIFLVDKWSKVKEKVTRTVYKLTQPKIPKVINNQIINSLQRGGHTIYIRHSPKDKIVNRDAYDHLSVIKEIQIPPTFFKGGCLNDQGRTEAWLIGEVFSKLNIPVGTIYSSPTCRTLETAQLAFGRVDIVENQLKADTFVSGSKKMIHEAKSVVMKILKKPPVVGKNKIISAHGGIISKLGWKNSYPNESGMFIVKHEANGGLQVVAEIELGKLLMALRTYLKEQ